MNCFDSEQFIQIISPMGNSSAFAKLKFLGSDRVQLRLKRVVVLIIDRYELSSENASRQAMIVSYKIGDSNF